MKANISQEAVVKNIPIRKKERDVFTVKIFWASIEAFLIFLALLSGRFLVTKRGSEDASSMLNQELYHG